MLLLPFCRRVDVAATPQRFFRYAARAMPPITPFPAWCHRFSPAAVFWSDTLSPFHLFAAGLFFAIFTRRRHFATMPPTPFSLFAAFALPHEVSKSRASLALHQAASRYAAASRA
jgi:hypothetical protein